MVTTHFDLVSGLSWAPGGPKRAPFGPKCPLALNFHGPILCGNFFSKYRLVGCPKNRSGMLCSSSTVIVHIEPPSLRKRSKRGKKGPLGPNLVPRGPPRTSEVPERTFYGQNGPFLPRFDCFLKLGGSIWTITMLDEQSIPIRFSGHPTSLYFEKKNSHTKLARGNLGLTDISGQMGPF